MMSKAQANALKAELERIDCASEFQVVDGHTDVTVSFRGERVRLISMDSPEKRLSSLGPGTDAATVWADFTRRDEEPIFPRPLRLRHWASIVLSGCLALVLLWAWIAGL